MTTARWKSSGAYEDQFERNIEEPRENSFGTCPMCGARGQYKCKGKVKGSIRKTRYLFLGQKYKDNRVTIKKFGDTPKNMSWWEFYKLMCSIFDEDAAGTRTWQNHFGGEDEVQENEPTGEHITAETPESEDDDAAVGETGTDEVEETESGSVADNEPAPGAGEEQKDDSTDRDTDCREDNREPADRSEEQAGEKSLGEQIAPAQKSAEILEKSEPESIEKKENEAQSIEENEPKIENEKPETEAIEVCMTRREYMNTLTVAKLADYIAEEHHSGHLLASDLIFPEKIRQWLRDEVDRYGKAQS